jgi:Ca-activated chloride channel family protein
VLPSRIERARYKAHDLLAANKDGLNALIGYAGQSFVVAPLTSDAHSLDDLLDAMAPDTMPVDGDNAAQAIEQGVQLIHNAKAGSGSLVLITDDADSAAQTAARHALASGVHVSVLGIGTEQGAPVPQADGSFLHDEQGNIVVARRNDGNLRALVQAGGGLYVVLSEDGSDTAALHAELQPTQHTAVADGQRGDAWQDEGPWLLLPLLLVAGGYCSCHWCCYRYGRTLRALPAGRIGGSGPTSKRSMHCSGAMPPRRSNWRRIRRGAAPPPIVRKTTLRQRRRSNRPREQMPNTTWAMR